ncbi:MAG: group III truncated hemoglobin [Marinoscillum sp.]
MPNKDIETLDDIKFLVDTFYTKVRSDELIGPIFNEVIQNRWPVHLEKMYSFWQTVLLSEHTYFGRPFPPHAQLPVDASHFDRWITLFYETIEEHFSGEKADEAKIRSGKMAMMFQYKIEYFRDSGKKPLI